MFFIIIRVSFITMKRKTIMNTFDSCNFRVCIPDV